MRDASEKDPRDRGTVGFQGELAATFVRAGKSREINVERMPLRNRALRVIRTVAR